MESNALNDTVGRRERLLGRCFADRVDEDLGGGLDVESHGGQIVCLCVPCDTTDDMLEDDGGKEVGVTVFALELPFAVMLLLVTSGDIDGVSLLGFLEDLLGELVDVFTVELRSNKMNLVFVGDGEQALVHSWAPLNLVNDLVRQAILADLLA